MDVEIKNFKFTWPGERSPLLAIPHWKLKKGSHVLIWGESGKGKTTILHCIGGLLEATEGDVVVDNHSYQEMRERDRLRLRRDAITLVFQRLNLIIHLTVVENIMLGLNGRQGTGKVDAICALKRVGMADVSKRLAWNLSAGEQQRVALARALVRKTPLTLADEPTANLNKANAIRVIEELLSDVQQRNHTLIVVSHDERIRDMFDLAYNIEEISTPCPV